MGWLDTKWIIEYEYSEGLFHSIKKSSIEVDASSEYSAKDKAKELLKSSFSYLKILSATRKDQLNKVSSKPEQYTISKETDDRLGNEIIIGIKKSEIAKENRRPKMTLFVGLLISGAAFLFGWIPYWYFDSKLRAIRDTITSLYRRGHDVNEPEIVELINQGLQFKANRDSIIWLPFVILGIAIVATIVITVIASKKKPARVAKCRRELEDLEKKISER